LSQAACIGKQGVSPAFFHSSVRKPDMRVSADESKTVMRANGAHPLPRKREPDSNG